MLWDLLWELFQEGQEEGVGRGKPAQRDYEQVPGRQQLPLGKPEARVGEPVSDRIEQAAPGMLAPGTSFCACTA